MRGKLRGVQNSYNNNTCECITFTEKTDAILRQILKNFKFTCTKVQVIHISLCHCVRGCFLAYFVKSVMYNNEII